MGNSRTRHEVSGLAFEHLALACEWAGFPFEELLDRDMPSHAELRQLRRRFDWELFAELCDRLAARLGDDAALREAAGAVAPRWRPPFVGLLRRLPPATFFDLTRWVPQQVYRVPEFGVTVSGGEVCLTIRIPAPHRGSRAFLVFVCAMTEVLTQDFAEATTRTEVSGPREGKISITGSPARARKSLASKAALAVARRVFDELSELASELAMTQSEREAAREEAARAEAFARNVLAAVEDALVIVDPTTLVVRWASPATERLLGQPIEQVTGRPALELFDPQERGRLEAWMRSAGAERLEISTRRKTGSAAGELELSLLDHRREPAIAGLLIQARDVTEQNKAKRAALERDRAYASLLLNLRGMGYRCRNDADWTMELVTDGCEELTGYPADALRLNRDLAFGSLVHPDDSGPLWDKCQANLAARRPCQNEYRIQTRAGRFRWILDIAHGVYADDGSLVAIEGFLTDVDDRRKLEEQLAHAARIEGLGRLASGIAHDFNNYLTAVIGLATLVRQQLPVGSTARSDVESIESASLKAAELTSQLLSFARRSVLRASVLSVNEVVRDMERLLERTLGSDIVLTTVLAPDLWASLVDRGQLESVLLNLAVNARDAMLNGGKLAIETKNVTLGASHEATHPAPRPGDWVTITVSDTGQGIPPEIQGRIFEPFVTTKAHGTGLGLATAYGAVCQAGGHIDVSSKPGQGTTFKISLPRTKQEPKRPKPVVVPSPTQGETVLFVDDNATLRSVVARQLRLLGYNVLVATDGREAIELARTYREEIHVLLTDVAMPQMGGVALAQALRQERPRLRVLYVSGHAEDAVVHPQEPGRGYSFLAKPFTREELALRIREVLNLSQTDAESRGEGLPQKAAQTHDQANSIEVLVDRDSRILQ